MSIGQNKIWKLFSSVKLAIWLLAAIAALSLAGTFTAQEEEARTIYSSWWFILPVILLAVNLSVCLLQRFSWKGSALGTSFCHLSILVILLGALIGLSCGQKGYLRIGKGEEASSFLAGHKRVNLGFSLRLDDFIYRESIDPKERLLVYAKGKEAASIPTEEGAEQEIAHTGFKIKILRYLPDFVMDVSTKEVSTRSAQARNPAIEIELRARDGSKEAFWVFARYPDMHGEKAGNFNFVYHWVSRHPKDFISKAAIIKDGREILQRDIRVNFPLQFAGYAFFQSTYDTAHLGWSGLRVVRDPGIAVVYMGFGLLIAGLFLRFYLNPIAARLQKRKGRGFR